MSSVPVQPLLLIWSSNLGGFIVCFVFSKASLARDHQGCGSCCGGHFILGLQSKWEAQTILQVAEEWRAAGNRGNILFGNSAAVEN